MASLTQRLAAGEPVEIAGYRLAPALAHGLERATLAPPSAPGRLAVIELSTQPDATPSPAVQSMQAHWLARGWAVHGEVVRGPAFWQTTEIEIAPALLAATVGTLAEAVAA